MSNNSLPSERHYVTTSLARSEEPFIAFTFDITLTKTPAITYLFHIMESQGTPNVSEALESFLIERAKVDRAEAWGE